jgi:RNA polymerase sigma-70 factor (ECF subfamily)
MENTRRRPSRSPREPAISVSDARASARAVAYRMLGSLSDADDVLQEAWLRLDRSDAGSVENMRAWLTTVVARLSLDELRARKARREGSLDSWLPEPLVAPESGADPEQEALLADSVGVALLVVLETLEPAERLAFVLHDMLALPFGEIAPIVGRSPVATRQLASRARRRVRGATRRSNADPEEQRAVVDAFLAAARAGDVDALVALLDPDVVLRVDRGRVPAADRVLAVTRGAPFARYGRAAIVNGAWGVVVATPRRPIAAIGLTVAGGRIVEIDLVADPAKLQRLPLEA